MDTIRRDFNPDYIIAHPVPHPAFYNYCTEQTNAGRLKLVYDGGEDFYRIYTFADR